MTGGDAVPLLLARLIRLSLALTPLLLVRAAPSASALSVRALLLARLLGPRPAPPVPELPAGSLARRELEACGWAGLESVTSLAMLMADTCSHQASLRNATTTRLPAPHCWPQTWLTVL